jgi:hypothetical protein
MKNRIKNWCFPPTLIAVLIMLFLTLIHRVYGDSLKQLDPLSLESSQQKSASNNHRASIDNLVQIGFRNGFAGKGSFDKIIKVLNVESTNELNSYF